MGNCVKRFITAVVLLSIYITGSGFSFFTTESPLHVLIKDEIIKQVSAMTGRQITVGKVYGGLINSVTLEDIKIPKDKNSPGQNVITIKKAVIRYNLMKAAIAKNILPSIYKIELDGPSVYLERDKKGEWNLVKLVTGNGSAGPAPVFKAKIEIKNGSLAYDDQAGFNPPLKERFTEKFEDVRATVNLSKKDVISFNVFGNSGTSSIKADGKVNLAYIEKGKKSAPLVKADIKITAKALPITLWNPYLGIPGLKDIDLKGSIDLDLSTSTQPGAYVLGQAQISNGTISGRPFDGIIKISLKDNKANIDLGDAVFCGGKINGGAKFDFSKDKVLISALLISDKTDINSLAAGTYGVQGSASARIGVEGSAENLNIISSFDFYGADIAGIKPDKMSLSGNLKKDVFYCRRFNASTSKSRLSISGELAGLASGKFIKSPFDNIKASGDIDLNNEIIYGQKVGTARGSFKIDKGIVFFGNTYFIVGASRIDLSGKIGPGKDSDLSVFSSGLQLSDFSFLTAALPQGFRGITGASSFDAKISGVFPEKFDKNIIGKIATLEGSVVVNIKNAVVAKLQITSAETDVIIHGGKIEIRKASVHTKSSYAEVKGSVDRKGGGKIELSGNINLVDLSPFTQKYAKILGIASVEASMSGSLQDPVCSLDFTVCNPSYNDVRVDKISGKLLWSGGVLKTQSPVKVELKGDIYNISGRADLGKKEPQISARVYTKQGGLDSAISIAQMAYLELIERKGISGSPSKVNIFPQKLELPSIFDFRTKKGLLIYTPEDAYLKAWTRSIKRAATFGKMPVFLSKIKASGVMDVDVKIEVQGLQTKVAAGISVENGKVGAYEFDNLSLSSNFINGRLYLNKLSLIKGRGMFEADGLADMNGAIKVKAYSKNLKLDGIESAFVSGFPVEGSLSGTFEAAGMTAFPVITAQVNLSDAGFGGLSLKEASGKFVFSPDKIEIIRLEIGTEKQKTMIKGMIPLTKKDDIDLKIKLGGENTGLIASLFKGVAWTGGSGSVDVAISGKITDPKMDGTIYLKDAVIDIGQIKSTIYGLNADLMARGNYFEVKRLSGVLQGQMTLGKSSPFSFAGYADLSRVFGRNGDVDIDLAMADNDIYFEIPGLYSGGITMKDASLKGKLYPGQEKGNLEKPLFKAAVVLHDGSMSLPQAQGSSSGQKQYSPISLDLLLGIGKNVSIVQGQADRLISTDLSSMNLEITASGLDVKGGIFSPAIEGDVNINKGSVNILGRDFSILSKTEQKKYFTGTVLLEQDNTAQFLGGAIYGAVPTINVTAISEVYVNQDTVLGPDTSQTNNKPPQSQKVYIITNVSGMPGVLEKEKALNIVFYPFIEDISRIPSQLVEAPYNQDQVRIMLLPDFFKQALGVSNGGTGGIDANAALADYANTRFQSVFSSTVGSRIEKALDLESFTLSYNFGRDLEKLLPTTGASYAYAEQPQIGVDFVKGFFGRLFIEMRYAQTQQQVNVLNPTSLNYQLTYILTPIWSVVYYREPITFQELNSSYYKTMLQAVYKL